MVMELPDVVARPHFELTSYRVNNKIIATLDISKNQVCLMLSEIDQSVFCAQLDSGIFPVPNKWGLKGASYVDLSKVKRDLLLAGLLQAYKKANPKK